MGQGSAAWKGSELSAQPELWSHTLTPANIAGLAEAVDRVESSTGLGRDTVAVMTARQFPLEPGLASVVAQLKQTLWDGRGFGVLRGFPTAEFTEAQTYTAYLGLGLHVGLPVTQNAFGHIIGHVCDHGEDPADPTTRVYRTSKRQRYHTDSCDVVGLLCLTTAAGGGTSSIVSSTAIYDRIRDARPDLAAVLEQPFFWDRKGEVPAGKLDYYSQPIFARHHGRVLCIYDRNFLTTTCRFPQVPPLTPLQVEALDLLETLAESREYRLDMELAPGDMQFLHNHQILHARSAIVNTPDQRRHLLRLWLSLDAGSGWDLPPAFGFGRYANIDRSVGPVGGIIAGEATPKTVPDGPE